MFDSQDISTSATSNQTSVHNLDKASIHVVWSGVAPLGELKVQATNDSPDNPNAVWREVVFSSAITITGNSGDHDIVFNELPFNAIRLQYDFTSGAGTLNATLSAKVVGA